ncbi:NAD(P)/FAD-dependent oxidoreductase [Legionella oakridgensis]|uniref:Protein CbrA n=2 Tax=Legionella oakridgensis TaxID=29423 RepID=W0BCK7_9GAMM|nr:FAD-dependent monooxygenase [Legionella oakridgensis]AHE67600.1 FAD binding domain protein [Legionella oakridgensis ATCC 33761 = DSM 21215]ETO92839.1 FAD binding domain protein [Legionella oakridgensis RV-2-2007]KTD37054.1 FAD dependent oxidoreductase [Legionella oakridgensis]STY20637.1 FAD dependent oxidoreductase [Legionella longbeachae]
MNARDNILDALIIGGGPAGATTGILLAKAGWSIGIIEKKVFPRRKVCGEFMSATNLDLIHQLGIADFYLRTSGPEIQRVGLFAADAILATKMPSENNSSRKWGRALGREHLDLALMNRAAQLGVTLWQPCIAQDWQQKQGVYACNMICDDSVKEIKARFLIIACGSWEGNDIQCSKYAHKPSDLLAFKAHFRNTELDLDLMPLIAFPGGYGGLVHSDHGRVSLSFCIRRDVLQQVRKRHPGMQAGEASLSYIKEHCLGVQRVLAHAQREGGWLACGPIRPGVRQRYHNGIFYIGNIAGEAHPIVAEGISMAMQSAWLLSHILVGQQKKIITASGLNKAGREYSERWYQHFATRIHAAGLFSQVAMRPWTQAIMIQFIKYFPKILTYGAKLSGKVKQVVCAEDMIDKDN